MISNLIKAKNIKKLIKENKISFFNLNIGKAKKASLFANLFDNKNDSEEIYSFENLFKKSQGKLFSDNNQENYINQIVENNSFINKKLFEYNFGNNAKKSEELFGNNKRKSIFGDFFNYKKEEEEKKKTDIFLENNFNEERRENENN